MRINTNVSALNTYGRLKSANSGQSKSLEKLSSGFRINRAGDDAAGLAISEKMRSQIRGLYQAERNSQDGISLIQTAEGALTETHAILQRMRELVVQSNNDTNTPQDRQKLQEEIVQLHTEVTEIADRTEFNGSKLLDGSLGVSITDGTGVNAMTVVSATAEGISFDLDGIIGGTAIDFAVTTATNDISITVGTTTQTLSVTNIGDITAGTMLNFDDVGVRISFSADADVTTLFNNHNLNTAGTNATLQIGANGGQTLDVSMGNMKADQLGNGFTGVDEVNVTSATQTFQTRLDIIDGAIETVSQQRSKLGAYQNRLEHTIKNLNAARENLTASESRIRDVDMAEEMMEFTKNNILTQASTAMLAQANQVSQSVLQLLR